MAEGKNWRKTFAFSKRDEATLRWWDAQENPSISLQLLIREEIERNGFTDKLNAPVSQQPRRGRPPKGEGDESDLPAGESDLVEPPARQSPTSTGAVIPKTDEKLADFTAKRTSNRSRPTSSQVASKGTRGQVNDASDLLERI